MKQQPTSAKRGGISVLLIVSLTIFGVMMSVWCVNTLAVASVQRAVDDFRQVAVDDRRFERITEESILSVVGTRYARTGDLVAEVENRLALVNSGLPNGDVRLAAATNVPAVADLGMYPDAGYPALDARPASLRSLAGQDLLDLAGPMVALSAQTVFTFTRGHIVFDQARNWTTNITAQLVSAPITASPVVSYIMPREVAQSGFANYPLPGSSPLPGGLVPNLDNAYISDLRVAEQLPYVFRNRAVLVEAYQYVFSAGYVQRVIDGAGVTHVGDLDVGAPMYPALTDQAVPVLNPRLSGVSEPIPRSEFELDLAQLGLGERRTGPTTTLSEVKQVVVLYTRGIFTRTIRLRDSGGNASGLLLLLVGPGDPNGMPLEVVQTESITRPVVVVCYHANYYMASGGLTLNGALLLDPQCRVDPTMAPLRLAHVSYHAYSGQVHSGMFEIAGPMPLAATQLAPRVNFVATGRSAR